MPSKPKTVEITLRVRAPAKASAADVRREVADDCYGKIYVGDTDRIGCDLLSPRWGAARVVRKPSQGPRKS